MSDIRVGQEDKPRKDFDPVPAGVHIAGCYGIYDIGRQVSTWQGKEKIQRKIVFAWEIPDERIDIEKDGKTENLPRAISKVVTASMFKEARFRKMLEAWRGRPFTEEEQRDFSLKNVLGKFCQILVTHEAKKDGSGVWTQVETVMPLPKNSPKMTCENPLVMWKIGDPVDGVPQWIIKKAMQSPDWPVEQAEDTSKGQDAGGDDDGDSVPF